MEQTPSRANESLLGNLQKTLRFWIITLSVCTLSSLIIAVLYGLAVNSGMFSTDNIFITFIVLLILLGSWWGIGEWMKARYNYGN